MLLPPKIDHRTYDDIVAQTVKLGQHFTVQDSSDVVANKLEELLDRTIAEDIKDAEGKIIAAAGTLIDQKIADALLKIESLKQVKVNSKGWCKAEKPDAGLALIRIFGRMAALVSDRLNQVPEKNFLAFLDLIGTQILPPQPARVPLTFSLATGAKVDALVPARTQVAASATAGEENEVVFETEHDLVVTTAQLQAVFVRQPETDCYSDYTQKATGIEDAAFSVFIAEVPIEHSLYLACDELFTLPEPKRVTLTINSRQAAVLAGLPITWSYWDGATWQGLSSSSSSPNLWQVTIANLPIPAPRALDGIEARWLRAQLNHGSIQSLTSLPTIDQIAAKVEINRSQQIAPDLCFFNTNPIDLSKDFYPFGEQPRFNDTLYIASKEAFARPGAKVKVVVTLSTGLNFKTDGGVDVTWEAWDGHDWQFLTKGSSSANAPSATNFTGSNTAEQPLELTLPASIAPTTVNGETNYWIRARITNKGSYGIEAAYGQMTGFTTVTEDYNSNASPLSLKVNSARGFMANDRIRIGAGTNSQEDCKIVSIPDANTFILDKIESEPRTGSSVLLLSGSNFSPPSVRSLRLSYEYTSTESSLSACRTYNDLTYLDRLTTISEDAAIGQNQLKVDSIAGWAVGDRLSINPGNQQYEIEAIAPNTKTVTLKTPLAQAYAKGTQVIRSFEPFTATADSKPTLYLGFDQPFPNQPVALYAQVEPPKPDEVKVADGETISTTTAQPLRLIWEYASLSGWKRLGVQDETSAFAERGMIRFIGPPDFTTRTEFGKSLYWLRVCKESGEFRVVPRLRRLLTNTTWASQTTTIENENLGSSNGNPNQTFRTTNSPVLLGQRLEVKEQEVPSPAEQSAIEQLEGADAVTILRDEAGHPEAVWVCWHEVPDFYSSGLRDRHYTINRMTGEVLFGDGQQGMVPPIGRNNIRMSLYQIGGGEQGNQGAKTVTQLKTTVPYIDSVTNLEAAGGGTDLEPMERVKERGPKVLRHRDRAVTVQDFEDLAYEASPDVARVKAIAPNRILTNGKVSSFDPLAEGLWLDANNQARDEHNKVQNVGQVQLLIVPRSSALQPIPSLALIEQVEAYIRDRASPTVILRVGSPEWLKVSVTAEVVPTSLEVADTARNAVIQRLENFLQPLTGGVRGQGWDFGREPHKSDFYALIEAINSVDYVRSLSVNIEPKLPEPPEPPKPFLIFSGNHNIAVI